MMKYQPNGPYAFQHRLAMCEEIGETEGTEIGDAIVRLCSAANILRGIGEDHNSELALLTAENVCREYVRWLREDCDIYSIYEMCPIEAFKHFSGGAEKLSEKELFGEEE